MSNYNLDVKKKLILCGVTRKALAARLNMSECWLGRLLLRGELDEAHKEAFLQAIEEIEKAREADA